MAVNRWLGGASAVAQVDTLVVGGTIEVGDLFNVTINGKTVSVAAATTVIASVVAQILAALQASTIAEFAEQTYASTSPNITATANTTGKPFTLTVLSTEAGGGALDAQTFTTSTTTASSGPNDWGAASNWSLAAVPVNTNDVS